MNLKWKYKGYTTKPHIEDNKVCGKVENISDLIYYEGDTLEEAKRDFEVGIDDYIEFCKMKK